MNYGTNGRIDNYPNDLEPVTSPAEWRWIPLKGYMFTGENCYIRGMNGEKYKLEAGIKCTNCGSKVYYDKCPNDECHNFYMYTNYIHVKGFEDMEWELVFRQYPNLKESA